ncbi:MAG: YebC/PmpR family DNA-binding transcriptional regulator [Ardenticatenaceae bacterium]|nr:YebC/PmpR family DNA-binding transcriptional regulator [Ardenticatenaceae bacterium]HBY94478.1 YebC/PmpR family DNA-binding transcriptional regulator [Chloroflexota bacterium]
MSGHSKWANIKHRKAASDAKKGKLFTKIARDLESAARQGGGDPEANFNLRLALDKARAANMPKENVERAIKRGTGELQGEQLDEIFYEAYGPNGTAIMLKALTDNRNRTVSEIRTALRKHGGSLGESGSVAWQFDYKGLILVPADGQDPEAVMLTAIDAGAEDVEVEDGYIEITTDRSDLQSVQEALSNAGVQIESAELSMVPKTTIPLDFEQQLSLVKLIDVLEELDDIQQVYTNVELSNEVLEAA